MISPLIKWDHTEDWFVMKYSVQKDGQSGERKVTLSLEEDSYISGHIIDGKFFFQNVHLKRLSLCISILLVMEYWFCQAELLCPEPLICNWFGKH